MDQPVAIITGAGRGIGRATACELARAGYRLALNARTESELRQTTQLAGGGEIFPADLADPARAEALVSHTLQKFGRIDALVHCAGMVVDRPLDQTTVQQWRAVLDTNLSAAFYLSRAVWPALKARGGVIVNISSLASRDPFPGLGAYGAAKAGLNLLGVALAREGAPFGIRVHTLALGAVETVMLRQLVSPEQFPTHKTMDPAEVAKLIAACLRDEMRYTSGEVIFVHKIN